MRTILGGLLATCILGCGGSTDRAPDPGLPPSPSGSPAPPPSASAPVAIPPAPSSGPSVLGEDLREATSIAVDADAVYWTNIGQDATGSVVRYSKRDASTRVLADGQAAPFALTSAGDALYWLNTKSGSGAIMSVPHAGGALATLASVDADSAGLVVASGAAYFVDGRSDATIFSVPLSGGPKHAVVSVTSAFSLAYDGKDFFYLIDAVMRVAPDGGAAARISAPCFYPSALEVDDSQVFWTCQDGTLRAVAKAGGPTRTLFSRNVGGGNFGGLVLDGANVYFTSTSDGTVARVAKQGGPVTVLASGEFTPGPLAVDDSFVYYGVRGRAGAKSAVKRVPK